MGIMDDILKKINPDEVKDRGFKFYDGLSDSHEAFFSVSMPPSFIFNCENILMFYSIRPLRKTED